MENNLRLTQPIELAGRKLLLVDDDRINRKILAEIVRPDRYIILEAESGEEALETYRRESPDLVLLDVMLPGIDGFATCRALKAAHGDRCAPILFITAKNGQDDVVEGLTAGGSDYLQKPFREKEVAARIRAHLASRILALQRESLVEQLSEANLAKNRVLGMAAHDLRNPLASIRGLTELLRDGLAGPLSADQINLTNVIHSASESMLGLVNELLDVATIESGHLNVACAPTDVSEIVVQAIAVANMEGSAKGTRTRLAAWSGDAVAMVDAEKIRQVVDNLLSNANKYSPPGSAIRVELELSPAQIRLSVLDQGPGIPASEEDRLFKDFGKLSARPTGGEKSTGLGLAICRKIVAAHEGQISARNLPEGGCEFRVVLPRLHS